MLLAVDLLEIEELTRRNEHFRRQVATAEHNHTKAEAEAAEHAH
jgi:hypothetical protein